jgi:hypothetical protein
MAAPPPALHFVAAVEAALEVLSNADKAGAAGRKSSPIGV